MLDTETLAQLHQTSIEERIALIESLLNSLKTDLKLSSEEPTPTFERAAFGFMKDTGRILGDVVAPVLPETDWEVLQ